MNPFLYGKRSRKAWNYSLQIRNNNFGEARFYEISKIVARSKILQIAL